METIYWLPHYALTKHPANSSTARTKLGSTDPLVILVLPFLCKPWGWIKLWGGHQDFQPLGQGHPWLRQVGWGRVVWGTLPACPPRCLGPRCWWKMLRCWRQEESLPSLPPRSMESREVLQSAAWRSWGRTPLQVTGFSHCLCSSLRASHCQPAG